MLKHKFVYTKFGKIHYLDNEVGSETIVAIHGWLGSPNIGFSQIVEAVDEALIKIITGPMYIVGHSYGGAITAALSHRSRFIKRVIICDPFFGKAGRSTANILRDLIGDLVYDKTLKLSLRSKVEIGGPQLSALLGWANISKMSEKDFNFGRIPVLALWGDRDRVTPWDKHKDIIAKIPNLTVKSFPGGHYWYVNHQRKFLSEIEDFISSSLPTAPVRARR
ncbi:MAG: lysophospholipase [Patescibacteria group bacterium]|nr:lysophospholipase [Patescibacteria group bacterium]MCL5431481.1 lysophospholipase [Patescibacteria group bacterium]